MKKQDLSLRLKDCRLNLRVSGLLIHHQHLLVMRSEAIPYYFLPGGRIRQNEPSTAALRREMQEELGETPQTQRLLWTAESFFTESTNGETFHEIGFYYLITLSPAALQAPLFSRPSFTRREGGEDGPLLQFLWQPLESIDGLDLRPAFIKGRIGNLQGPLEHVLDIQPTAGAELKRRGESL